MCACMYIQFGGGSLGLQCLLYQSLASPIKSERERDLERERFGERDIRWIMGLECK